MLTRILVGVIGVPLLLAVLFLCPDWALVICYAALCAVAQYELIYATGFFKNKIVTGLCIVVAALIPVLVYLDCPTDAYVGLLLALVMAFFLLAMGSNHTIRFEQIAGALFSAFVVPLFLSQVIVIRKMEQGVYLVLLPFLTAWMSDTGAYFVGTFLGRHKLCPTISPKKSVEGAVGGVVGALVGGASYGLVMALGFDFCVNWWVLALLCAAGSVCGQFGDLIFSYIKRGFGIKDYGKLFPGHGGVLDRFDSIFLTTPVTALVLLWLPTLLG